MRDPGAFGGGHHVRWSRVMHPPLDKAELDRGQRNDDRHQDHRLRRRAAEIKADDAVVPDLVDEDLGRPSRTALGYVVDDPDGVEEGIDDVDHQRKKAGGSEQWKDDPPKSTTGAGPVDCSGLDQSLWDRL